jgi:adenylate cyclase
MLAPMGSRSLVALPVRRRGRAVGSIWLEDPAEAAISRPFLRVLAGIAALRADEVPGEAPSLAPEERPSMGEPEAARSRATDLAARGLDPATLGEALYPDISVMVMRLADPDAPEGSATKPELIDAAVRAVQEVAAEQDIAYLKLVGCDIVGAAGFGDGDRSAAARIANTAVASRDRVAELFLTHGLMPNFRLGIDSGAAIGRFVGAGPALFNLWGEAVQTAQTMATAALPGAIQTSETVYEQLRQSFLFRPRGTFYLPPVGRTRTFVLAGHL